MAKYLCPVHHKELKIVEHESKPNRMLGICVCDNIANSKYRGKAVMEFDKIKIKKKVYNKKKVDDKE